MILVKLISKIQLLHYNDDTHLEIVKCMIHNTLVFMFHVDAHVDSHKYQVFAYNAIYLILKYFVISCITHTSYHLHT